MEMDSVSAKKSKKIRHNTAFTTREMVLAGMFAAVLAVISQLSIPTPAGVPVTIQVFGVALVGAVLGWKLGLCSVLVYILIGAAGLPVFANFGGGIRSLIGKGFKAKGKRLTTYTIETINELEPTRQPEPSQETEEQETDEEPEILDVIQTVAEKAKKAGKKVGVTTSVRSLRLLVPLLRQ